MKKVLIFDSGKGGKTIQLEIEKLCKGIEIEYLEDIEYHPYGKLSENKIKKRVLELLMQRIADNSYDAIVLACNSASTSALSYLRKQIKIPIIGVVPAIKTAINLTKSGNIALLATTKTINSDYTRELIKNHVGNQNVSLHCVDKLVELAEVKYRSGCCDISLVEKAVESVLGLDVEPDIIILGCTHFPILRNELIKIFKNKTIIDSGRAIANRVLFILNK
jgi:glutamate racemase